MDFYQSGWEFFIRLFQTCLVYLFANSSISVTEPTNHIFFTNDIVQVSIELYIIWVSEHWIVQKNFHVYIKKLKNGDTV